MQIHKFLPKKIALYLIANHLLVTKSLQSIDAGAYHTCWNRSIPITQKQM